MTTNLITKFKEDHTSIAVFLNRGKHGKYLNFRADRWYRDFDTNEFKYTNSFGAKDLHDLLKVVQQAIEFSDQWEEGDDNGK